MKWFMDTETTGLNGPAIEIALVPEEGEGWTTLIAQQVPIEQGAFEVHGITDAMCDATGINETKVAGYITTLVKDGDEVWCHNVGFDRKRMEYIFAQAKMVMPKIVWKCTLEWSRKVVVGSHKLEELAKRFKFSVGGHRAYGDAKACRELYHTLTTIDFRKEDYVKVVGPRILWGAMYTKKNGVTEFKEFEVRAIVFTTSRFIVIDKFGNERAYLFGSFVNKAIPEIIIKVMA